MLRMEENCWQTRGWSVYLSAEDTFVKWMADRGWYAPDTPGNYPDAEPVSGEPEPSRATYIAIYAPKAAAAVKENREALKIKASRFGAVKQSKFEPDLSAAG